MADNPILQLLLQGAQPDPAGALMAKAFLEGRLPGDPVVNLQTTLSMLSPGAVAERRAAEPGLTELLGLAPGQENRIKEMATGLAPTAAQELAAQTTTHGQLMQYLAAAAERAQAARGLDIKQQQADTAAAEHERKVAEGEAREAQLRALADALDELAATRRQTRAFRNMAYTGIGADGKPLTEDERAMATKMAGVYQEDPVKLQLAKALLYSGVEADRKLGAELIGRELGVDTSEIAEPVGYFQRAFDKIMPGPSAKVEDLLPPPKGGISGSERQAIDQELERFRLNLKDLLEPKE